MSFARFCLILLLFPLSITVAGCGGTAENSVSAPPAAVETAEETAARQAAYQEEQAKMQERDRQSSSN
jgi:hypothetical protein